MIPNDVGRAAIRRVKALAQLDTRDCDELLHCLVMRRFGAGELVCQEGDPGDTMAIVVEGTLSVRVNHPDGEVAELGRAGVGELFGELACLDPAPRSATLLALEPTTVFEMSCDALDALRRASPTGASTIVGVAIREATRRILLLEERIERELAMAGPPDSADPEKVAVRLGTAPTEPPPAPRSSSTPADSATMRGGRLLDPARATAGGAVISTAALAALPIFSTFTTSELDALIGVAVERRFAAGDVICREGDAAGSCFILVNGEVEILKESSSGPVAISRLGPGTLIGQIALVDRRPRSATVRALRATTALGLPRDVFDGLLAAANPLAHRFQEQVAIAAIRQLRAATPRLAAHLAKRRTAGTTDPRSISRLRGVQAMLREWALSNDDVAPMDTA